MADERKWRDAKDKNKEYRRSGRAARRGNTLLSYAAIAVVAILVFYAFYSLWYTYKVYHNAFLGSDLMDLKPSYNGQDTDNRLTFRELLKINKDTRSWLTIDDTKIDYPVVQGEDNMEYVNKNMLGNFELSGSIFLSYDNTPDFSDPYNLLYGHHMNGGGMFGDVLNFREASYFNPRLTGILYLPDKTYSVTLYACVDCSAYDPNIFYAPKTWEDMAGFQAWLLENALQYRDIGIKSSDRVIVMTTCESAMTDGRCALVGRLDQIAMTEQVFSTTDVDDENMGGTPNTIVGARDFVRGGWCYWHIYIVISCLASLIVLRAIQEASGQEDDMTDEELYEYEMEEERKRKYINRGLWIFNLILDLVCIYFGSCILEPICTIITMTILTLLALAERHRRKENKEEWSELAYGKADEPEEPTPQGQG